MPSDADRYIDAKTFPYTTEPPGNSDYTVYVRFGVRAQSAEAAINKLRDILELADRGHQLYEVSDTWRIDSAARDTLDNSKEAR